MTEFMPSIKSLLTSIIHIFNHNRKEKLKQLFQNAAIPDYILRKSHKSLLLENVLRYLIQTSSLGSFINHISQSEWNQFYKKAAILTIPENVHLITNHSSIA